MIIEIKGNRYENPSWETEGNVATLKLPNEYTFSEAVSLFALEPGDEIEQYNDDEEQVGVYYIQKMGSIQFPNVGREDKITIRYFIGNIDQGTQQIIETNIEEASDAILELAAMMVESDEEMRSEIETVKEETKASVDKIDDDIRDQKRRVDQAQETLTLHNQTIEEMQSFYNDLADRVSRLENRLNGGLT